MQLNELLKSMVDVKASDIFIVAGLPLTYQANGRQIRLETPSLTPADTKGIVEAIYDISGRSKEVFENSNNHDDGRY